MLMMHDLVMPIFIILTILLTGSIIYVFMQLARLINKMIETLTTVDKTIEETTKLIGDSSEVVGEVRDVAKEARSVVNNLKNPLQFAKNAFDVSEFLKKRKRK